MLMPYRRTRVVIRSYTTLYHVDLVLSGSGLETMYVVTSCVSRISMSFAKRKSVKIILLSSDKMPFILRVATLRGVSRSVLSPGMLWWSSFFSLRQRLLCRGVVYFMHNNFFFLDRDPFDRKEVQDNSSHKGENLPLVSANLSSLDCPAPLLLRHDNPSRQSVQR